MEQSHDDDDDDSVSASLMTQKMEWFSAQWKLSSKGLTYLLHVSSFGPSPDSSG